MRVVFLGSPAFALPSLRGLIESEHEVVAVITQPDRPAGRGRALRPPPVKELALARGLPVLQPKSVNAPGALDAVRGLAPDVLVIAAFGQILKQPLLNIPQRGSLNVHASLLPKYRGAAPVAAALLAGEEKTGVSIMEVVLALDAGPVVAQRELPIAADDTTGTLTARIAELGAGLLAEVIGPWGRGEITARPQDDAQSTYTRPVRPEDAVIDWMLPARDVWLRVRAYNPWPVAVTPARGERLRILQAWPVDREADAAAGTVLPLPEGVDVPDGAGFAVRCGQGLLAIVQAQRPGKRTVSGRDLLRGFRDLLGMTLGA